jgi:hypothetical protein
MAQRFIEASTLQSLEFILNGGVVGGVNVVNISGRMMDLHGKTLIVNSVTVTFSDPTGQGLTYQQVKLAIEAVVAGTTVSFVDGRLAIRHATGVTVGGLGTANAVFGFPKVDTVGVVYAPPDGTAPRVLSIGAGAKGDSYYAHLEVT